MVQNGYPNTVKFKTLTASDFVLNAVAQRNAIKIVDGQLLTEHVTLDNGEYRA